MKDNFVMGASLSKWIAAFLEGVGSCAGREGLL